VAALHLERRFGVRRAGRAAVPRLLPQRKLEEYLTADVYVSDAKLWRIWRDQRESVTVALLAMHPDDVPDSIAPVSDAEVERYYGAPARLQATRGRLGQLRHPARIPNAADSAAALAHARTLRTELAAVKAKFEDVAKRESADSGTGPRAVIWVGSSAPAPASSLPSPQRCAASPLAS